MKLTKSKPHYLEAMPLQVKRGLSRDDLEAVLKHAAGKVGAAHARGENISPEYQAAIEQLYKSIRE